jgi:hypothetical protein
VLAPAVSGDNNYQGLDPADINLINQDIDQPPPNKIFAADFE